MVLRKDNKKTIMLPDRAKDLRLELARKIASFMGSEQNRATDIPGVTLHRRIAPTAPCSMTYEPGVTVMAQGQKRVDLGPTTFIYGESRYLLTSVDLPIVSQIVEASVQVPCLAMSLKLEMPVVRELLRHDRHARTIGATQTVEFLRAAFEVGYESANQFNREYSRLFGQPPIRDIKALRTANIAVTSAI